MSSDEKRNNTIEKLRILLDNGSKKLHPKDGKYLQALHRRLGRTSTPQFTYSKRTASQDQVDESLKPRVVIHQKEQPKVVEFPEVCPRVEEKQPEKEKQERAPEDDGLFEVEKVEVEGPEFVEVTPKELPKKKEEVVEQKEKEFKEVPTETKDIKDDAVEEKSIEKDIPEWEPLPADQEKEELLDDDKKTADDEFFEEETPRKENKIDDEAKEEQVEVADEDVFKEDKFEEEDASEWEMESGTTKEKTVATVAKKKDETDDEFLEEEAKPLVFIDEDKKDDAMFPGIKSIDEKTARLLREHGIASIKTLRETPIKKLIKIKGIKRKLAKKIKKEVEALPLQQETTEDDDDWQIVDIKDDTSDDFEEFGETSTKQKVEKNTRFEEKEDEWETFTEEPANEKEQGYQHGDYTLYEKEIETKTGKKRTVQFFSKGEPGEGKSIALPQGYVVKVNKRTGVPYIKKDK